MSIVLRFFPNGEFSQGVDTSHKRRDKQRRLNLTQTLPLDPGRRDEYLQWIKDNAETQKAIAKVTLGSEWMSNCGNRYAVESLKLDSCTLGWEDKTGKHHSTVVPQSFHATAFVYGLTPLVHQSVESCENSESIDLPSSRKKLEGMTKNMSRNIRNGVYLLEQQPGGKDCLSFLTLTLPALSNDGLLKCCENWDYMVKRFLDWLRIRVQKQGINFMYVYATEIQTKRLELRQEYAPHLHLVFKGRYARKKTWAITPLQARKAWSACISSIVDEPFNRNALENLQRIKHSAARYLSKYLSKGTTNIPKGASEDTIQALRTQWGGMARQLCRAIRSNTVGFNSSSGHSQVIYTFLGVLPTLLNIGYVSYFKKGFVCLHISDVDGKEYGLHVCVGALSIPTYAGGLNAVLDYLSFEIEFHNCYE